MTIQVRSRHGDPLTSVEAWGLFAPPASETHWQEGRSAMELARAWTQPAGPAALCGLLATDPKTTVVELTSAVAEAQVAFDTHPGGRRNHDLLVQALCAGGETVVGVEAKADETYGQTVCAYAKAAAAKATKGQATNAPQRLTELLSDLAAGNLSQRPQLGLLRYQLLSGIAGTLAAAPVGGQAVFIVHEFVTDKTAVAKRQRNHAALALALKELFGCNVPEDGQWLTGPLHVPAARWAKIDLWVGQLVSRTPSATPKS
jgi:hypothetical protein